MTTATGLLSPLRGFVALLLVQNAAHFVEPRLEERIRTICHPYRKGPPPAGWPILRSRAGLMTTATGLLSPLRGFVALLLVQNAAHFVEPRLEERIRTICHPYRKGPPQAGWPILRSRAGLMTTATGLLSPLRG